MMLLLLGLTTVAGRTILLLLLMSPGVLRMTVLVLLISSGGSIVLRHIRRTSSQVDVHAPSILFRGVLKTKLLADLLDARLNLLDVVDRVITFSYYTKWCQQVSVRFPKTLHIGSVEVHLHMKVCLTMLLCIFYPRF